MIIYLVGKTTGAAKTGSQSMANALIATAGYRCCTKEEYLERMRKIRIADTAAMEHNLEDGGND